MKIKNEVVRKFQMGGEVVEQETETVEQPAPEQEPQGGEQDPLAQLLQIAAQALESQDCEAAMAVCQGLMQLVQQAQGGGAPPEEPTYQRKGGRLIRK